MQIKTDLMVKFRNNQLDWIGRLQLRVLLIGSLPAAAAAVGVGNSR